MPRNITVTFDDGTSHVYANAPDDLTPEVVGQRAASEFGRQVVKLDGGRPQEQSTASKFWDSAKDIGRSFVGGATDVVRGAGTALTGLAEGAAAFNDSERGMWTKPKDRTYHEMTDKFKEILPTPQGDSVPRQYLRAGLEGLGGSLVTGGTGPVNLIAGAGSGVGAETASQLAPGNVLAKVAGSVLGGVTAGTGAALATRVRPQTATVAKEAMEGISEQQLQAAQVYKNELAAKGTNIDLAQALVATSGQGGNIESLRNFLANRSQGNQVQNILREQPEQLNREATLTAGSLPGTNFSASQNANNVQQTATGRLQQEMAARKDAVDSLYEKAGELPADAADRLITIIKRDIEKPGTTTLAKERGQAMISQISGEGTDAAKNVARARAELDAATSVVDRQAARGRLAEANAALDAQTNQALQAKDVSTWIGELRGPYQGGVSLKQTHPKEQGQLKGLAGELNGELSIMSPEIKEANRVFKEFTETRINPLKQGPVGLLNQAHGADPATQAMVSKFDGLMNKGTDPMAKLSDIRTAALELGKKDPTAFEDAFKGWISRKVQSAMEPGVGNSPLPGNPDMAKKLSGALFDDPLQWQGIKDAVAAMAKIRGESPVEMIRGMENLRQMTKAMKSRPDSVGGMSPSDLSQMGGNSQIANAVRVFSFLPVNKVGEAIERATLGKTLSQFDTILTSPEGAKMLIELGKVPVMSRKAQVILGTWGGQNGNPDGLSDSNP